MDYNVLSCYFECSIELFVEAYLIRGVNLPQAWNISLSMRKLCLAAVAWKYEVIVVLLGIGMRYGGLLSSKIQENIIQGYHICI